MRFAVLNWLKQQSGLLTTTMKLEGDMRMHKSILAVVSAMGLAGAAAASDYTIANNAIQMKSNLFGDTVKVTVTGPNNFYYTSEKAGGNARLSASEMQAYSDGLYKFEALEIKELGEEKVQDDFNGRGLTTRKIVEANKVSGHFRIVKGAMIDSNLVEDESKSSTLNQSNK